jgi:CheY-like chemotaxis protein
MHFIPTDLSPTLKQSFFEVFGVTVIVLGVLFASLFLIIGAYYSAISTGVWCLVSIAVYWLSRQGYDKRTLSLVFASLFLIEPATAIVFSGGVESPYIVWLIVPIFAAAGLVGPRGAIYATASAVFFFSLCWLFYTPIMSLNELKPEFYQKMYLLSFVAAALYMGLLGALAIYIAQQQTQLAEARNEELLTSSKQLHSSQHALQQELDENNRLQKIITHELMTPTATLKMLAEQRFKEHLPVQHQSQLNDSLEHMLTIMDELRADNVSDFLQHDKPVQANVAQVITSAVKMCDAFSQGLKIELNDIQQQQLVWLPKRLLRQIIINIVKNCCVHAQATRLVISLQAIPMAGGALYSLNFDDDGVGVPANEVDVIFAEFTQGNHSNEGSGIGLALARQYARNSLRGDLLYHDSVLGGAQFSLSFRAAKVHSQAAPASAAKTTQSDISFAHLRILLVEDAAILREMTAHLLTEAGATVSVAEDGLDAISYLTTMQFDLVITDIHMPNMDGVTLAKHIQQHHSQLPVIGLTAGVSSDQQDILNAGARCVLSKPLELDALAAGIKQSGTKTG